MKMWKTAAVLAIAVAAAAIGVAVAPPVQGQTRVTPKVRALEMLSGGSRIGVSIRDVEDSDSKTAKGAATGVIVEEVATESPAEKAGIRKGDVIVEFDGERVRSVRQLTRLVQETPAGRTVPAVLQREGQRTTVSITPRDDGRFSFQSFDDLADLGRIPVRCSEGRAPETADASEPAHAANGLELRRAGRPRPPRHLDRFAVAAARRVLRNQGRGAGELGHRMTPRPRRRA